MSREATPLAAVLPFRPMDGLVLGFSVFRLELAEERLWKGDAVVRLRRKPFAILRYLAQHPQRLVTQAEVVGAVWGKIALSESLLRTHVRELRQVLGNGIIETVVGRGYRFVAEVTSSHERGLPVGDDGAASGPNVPASLLVGRKAESRALQGALGRARDGWRQVILISGEAGVGKTSLVDAFLESEASSGRVWAARGTCVEQYGSGEAYLPVLAALGSLCRGTGGGQVVEVLRRHAPTWLAQMFSLVGTEHAAELEQRAVGATQARMLRELAEALEVLAADRPVVLALDDLQWADHSTIELIAMLGRRREPARLLAVGTYRAGELAKGHPLTRVAGELVAHRQAASLVLEGFSTSELEDYVAARFSPHEFPSELLGTVLQSTGGNPLFVSAVFDDLESRAMVRAVEGSWRLSTTVDEVAARRPDSIRRLIDIQIDRMGAKEQSILEAASVAGLTFFTSVIAHALGLEVDEVDACCESLVRERQFLRFVGPETWPDGTLQSRYGFAHALYQHAALARSPSPTVRLLHRRVAEQLEVGHADKADTIAAELAVHYDEGHSFAKAAHYFRLAGERAVARHGTFEALAHFERARSLVARLPEGREKDEFELRLLDELGPCLISIKALAAPNLVATFERAAELAGRLGDDVRLCSALLGLQKCRTLKGELREVGEHAEEVMRVAERTSDPDLLIDAAFSASGAAMLRGRLEDARQGFARICANSARRREVQAQAKIRARSYLAVLAWLSGRPDKALALGRDAVAFAEEFQEPLLLAHALCDLALVHTWRREPSGALDHAQRALDLAYDAHLALWQSPAAAVVHWAKSELEPTTSAFHLEQLLAQPWEARVVGRAMHTPTLIEVCARAGRVEVGLEEIRRVLALVETTDERLVEPELHRLRGELLKSTAEPDAERSFTTAIEVARAQSSKSFELRAVMSLCRLATGAKKRAATEDLGRLLDTFSEGHETGDLAEARAIYEERSRA